jgi:hypothetical protein
LDELTGVPYKVLQALRVYQYLTPGQMALAGVSSEKYLLKASVLPKMREGKRNKFVNYQKFEKGRKQAYVYALAGSGAELLARQEGIPLENINYSKGGIQFVDDYEHRLNFTNFHILFRQWVDSVGGEVVRFQPYFERVEIKRKGHKKSFWKKKNLITISPDENIEPDALCKFSYGDTTRVFALEIEREKNNIAIYRAIRGHIKMLVDGTIKNMLNHNSANFVLYVFEREGQLQNIKKELETWDIFKPLTKAFVFNTQSNIEKDFSHGWHFIDGSEAKIFPKMDL